MPSTRADLTLPTVIADNLPEYLRRSGDTVEEYMDAPEPMYCYSPAHIEGWVEYDVLSDVMWIRTAFSGDPKQTKQGWNELKQLARNLGCNKIQFQTKHNPKVMKRLFKAEPVLYKMEIQL